ncbi:MULTISPECIES: DMT family transporter [Shimia]|uniref:DMT family transporter n=1 Tax=Shimia TaxID=573139 RepID=UPI001FB3795A|nr:MULTISPECIES: DMT family transporter [Shimia]MDV4143371.1 DMT family transporter [Shimia sp. FJ5]
MERKPDNAPLAIAISVAAIVLFDLMGLIIKHLSPRYGAAELSAYRNLFGILPSLIALWISASWHRAGRRLRIRQWRLALLRGAAVTFAQFMFYLSLGIMAFATATTISYSTALFTTALAVPLLGERVGMIRWGAVAIGFVGVVMIIQPGTEGFSWQMLLPFGAAALYAFNSVTARRIDADVPTPLFNLYSAAIAAVGSLCLALALGGFTSIASLQDLGWIILMGLFGGSAVLCLVIAFRLTEPSNLAPFSYFGIPIAFSLGWLFFDEAPIDDLLPGAVLIVAGGLMIVYRERRLGRR